MTKLLLMSAQKMAHIQSFIHYNIVFTDLGTDFPQSYLHLVINNET